jgi:hypothetical protein
MTTPKPIPTPVHPVADPKSGTMNKVWFDYFRARERIEASAGPPGPAGPEGPAFSGPIDGGFF